GCHVLVARPGDRALPRHPAESRDHRRRRVFRLQGRLRGGGGGDPRGAAGDLHQSHQAGQGDARHRSGSRRRAADGDRHQPHHRRHLLHRRAPGRRRRHDLGPLLQHRLLPARLPQRAHRVHGRGLRRYRQHPRGGPWRAHHRVDRRIQRLLHRVKVDTGRGLRHPDRRPRLQAHRPARHAGAREMSTSVFTRLHLRDRIRDRDTAVYSILLILALVFPMASIYATDGTALVSQATRAGTFVLLAIGLNVVVGFAGLLDLGYAAFYAIGAYSYALFASTQLASSPAHHAFHLPFWLMLFVALFVAAAAGAVLGFPTLRLRGDYLAIVTLGFGEIVP